MNAFILTTGRSGSLTFAEACRHISNYTSSHESRVGLVGDERLAYPDQIEPFLRDKSRTQQVHIEDATTTFPESWQSIGAAGDLDAALRELNEVRHKGKAPRSTPRAGPPGPASRVKRSVRLGSFRQGS